MFNSENHFIKGPASTFGKRRFEVRDAANGPFSGSRICPELDRLIRHEDEHVPDLLCLVLLHGKDDRIRAPRAKVVDKDVEELVQDLLVVVDLEAVVRVMDTKAVPV